MELTGKLKEQVEKTETKKEAKTLIKDTIEEAGMILDDAELDQVAGGLDITNGFSHVGVQA